MEVRAAAGGDVVFTNYKFLSDMTSHSYIDLCNDFVFSLRNHIRLIWNHVGSSETGTTRYDRSLIESLCLRVEVTDEGMTSLVDRCVKSLLVCYTQRFSFDTHHDPIPGELKVVKVSEITISMNSFCDSLVNQVLDLGACEPWCHHR